MVRVGRRWKLSTSHDAEVWANMFARIAVHLPPKPVAGVEKNMGFLFGCQFTGENDTRCSPTSYIYLHAAFGNF